MCRTRSTPWRRRSRSWTIVAAPNGRRSPMSQARFAPTAPAFSIGAVAEMCSATHCCRWSASPTISSASAAAC
jgi:hypothetical protein